MEQPTIEAWFIQYAQNVHNYLVYFTQSRDVDDLVQECFLKAIRGLSTYNGTCDPLTWLIAIARNVALDHRRQLKRSRVTLVELVGDIPANAKTPDQIAEVRAARDELLKTVEQMKAAFRDVVILRLFLEMSLSDTTRILGWTEAKVKVTQHRALRKIRTDLSEEIGGLKDAL